MRLIDLIDEAASRLRMELDSPVEIDELRRSVDRSACRSPIRLSPTWRA